MPLQDITNNIIVASPKREQRDWSSLSKTLDKMEDRHYKALAQYNAVQKAIGDLDLNEAEDEWKTNYAQNISDEINVTVDKNIGYYGNALSDAIRVGAKVYNDPALRGRIKAQQEYKAWKDSVLKGVAEGKWSQDVADMMIEQNPYSYIDKYEGETDDQARQRAADPSMGGQQQGKIVGGVYGNYARPVNQVNISAILEAASKRVAIAGGGSNVIYFKRADGTLTTNESEADPNNPYPWYIDKYENVLQIDKNKLKEAVRQLIQEGGYSSAIQQQLNVGLWKTGKDFSYDNVSGTYKDRDGNVIDNEYTDEYGQALSLDKYIESIIDPAARLMARNVSVYTRSPGLGMTTESKETTRKGKTSTGLGEFSASIGAPTTGSYTIDREIDSRFTYTKKKAAIREQLSQYAIDNNLNPNDPELLNKLENVEDANIKGLLYDYKYYDELLKSNDNFGKEFEDAMEYITAVENGTEISSNNLIGKRSRDITNEAFTYNGQQQEAIYINLKYENTALWQPNTVKDYSNDIINSITENGKYTLSHFGLSVEDGKLKIPRSSAKFLPKIIDAVEQVGFRGNLVGTNHPAEKLALAINNRKKELWAKEDEEIKRQADEGHYIIAGLNRFGQMLDKGITYLYTEMPDDIIQGINSAVGNTLNTEILYNVDGNYVSGNGKNNWENWFNTIVPLYSSDAIYDNEHVLKLQHLLKDAKSRTEKIPDTEIEGKRFSDDYDLIVNEKIQYVPYSSLNEQQANILGLNSSAINDIKAYTKNSVKNYNPEPDEEFYYTDERNKSLRNITDNDKRSEVLTKISAVISSDPSRVSIGFNNATGETVINVSEQKTAKIAPEGFTVMGDFFKDNEANHAVYKNPTAKGARELRNAELASITVIPVVPQKLGIVRGDNGLYVLSTNTGNVPINRSLAEAIIGYKDAIKNIIVGNFSGNITSEEIRADLGLSDDEYGNTVANAILNSL